MTVHSGRLRRGGALISLTGVAAIVAFSSASAYVGGNGSGPQATSDAPDLRTATVLRAPVPSSPLAPQIRFCYDQAVTTVVPNDLYVQDYDSAAYVGASTAAVDPAAQNCVIADFPAGTDVGQGTLGTSDTGAVTDIAGLGTPEASTPLAGSKVTPVAGATTGPDLVTASAQAGTNQVTYTFDENVDPNGAFNGSDFGYYTASSDGAAPITGMSVAAVDGPTVVVNFAAAVNGAKQFITTQDAVTDIPTDTVTTGSSIGSAGTGVTASPSIASATKQANNQIVNVTFNAAVNPGSPTDAFAYREDGGTLSVDSIGTANDVSNQTLTFSLNPDAQKDPASVVRIGITPGAAPARTGGNDNTYGGAAIGTANSTAGYTDGPDLLSTVIDDAANRAAFSYDEPLSNDPANTPAGSDFTLKNSDGTTQTGQNGGEVLSADRKTVSVVFSGSVSAAVGVANDYAAIVDETAEQNVSPEGSVGVGPAVNCQPGTCPVQTVVPPVVPPVVTPVVTPTVTPTVTPPPPSGRKTPRLSAKVSPKRDKRKPFRYTTRGKVLRPAGVSASAGCKGSVKVQVKVARSGKTVSSRRVKVRSSCRFTSKVSFKSTKRFRHRSGKLKFVIRFHGNGALKSRRVTRTVRFG